MNAARPVELTLVLTDEEATALLEQRLGEMDTLEQIVQYLACHAGSYRLVVLGRLDEAALLADAASRSRHSLWEEMVSESPA